jgi:nucleoid DNA-binding protein
MALLNFFFLLSHRIARRVWSLLRDLFQSFARRLRLAQPRGKKTTARSAIAKQPVPKAKPVKETLTKAALVNLIAEENGLTRDVAKGVLATIENMMTGSIHPRGVGEFTLPGLLKISLRKVPARKAGTLIRNPSTGEMVPGAAKPASVRVKIRALSKLKAATAS